MTIQISNRMFNMKIYTTAMVGMKLGQVKAKPARNLAWKKGSKSSQECCLGGIDTKTMTLIAAMAPNDIDFTVQIT